MRLRILIVACIASPIFIAPILAWIGPHIGPYLPPALAYSVNVAVMRSFWITVVGIVVLIFLVSGFAAVFRLFMVGIIALTVMAASTPMHADSIFPFIDRVDNRSVGDPFAHYAITEGLVSSSAHRTAMETDCAQETLKKRDESKFHKHADLRPPKEYRGKYVESVSASTFDEERGRIMVLLVGSRDESAWPLDIAWTNSGDTLVWEGVCTSDGIDWAFSAFLPNSYQRNGNSSGWWLPPQNL